MGVLQESPFRRDALLLPEHLGGNRRIGLGWPRWLPSFWSGYFGSDSNTTQAGVIDRVFLTPFLFPRRAIISAISMPVQGAGAGGTNLRIGIYEDLGGTPVGGALLETSGDIDATSTGVKTFTLTTPREFDRGISAWMALVTEDAVIDFFRATTANTPIANIGAEQIIGCRYAAAAPVVLDAVCPAVASDGGTRFNCAMRLDGWAD